MTFDYVEDAVEVLDTLPNFECACNDCAAMCKHTPCVPTPEEAIKIIDAGFENKLCIINSVPSSMVEDNGQSTQILSPRTVERENQTEVNGQHWGTCVFLENDLCTLHDTNLKPSEGRKVVCHTGTPIDARELVIRSWEGEQAEKVLELWENKIPNRIPDKVKEK